MTYIIPKGLRIPVARMAVGLPLAATSFLAGDARRKPEAFTCVTWCAPDFWRYLCICGAR